MSASTARRASIFGRADIQQRGKLISLLSAHCRQDSVATSRFLDSKFQWLLRGGELDEFNFGSVPVAAVQIPHLNALKQTSASWLFTASRAEIQSWVSLPWSNAGKSLIAS